MTNKFTKNKAIVWGSRFKSEEKGDWLYTDYEGKTKNSISGYGLDENEKWYWCYGEEVAAETPSGVKCELMEDQTDDEFCKTSDFVEECDYNTKSKTGSKTVEDLLADYEKDKATTYLSIYDKQGIFWECEFTTSTEIGKELSSTCKKAKLVKTKHDKDFENSEKCFASKFGGMVSALLVLTGLMN